MNAMQFQKKLLSMQENMMNFALMLTANRDEARDLFQETTLKALINQDKFVDNVNFKGWVLTIMRNVFINSYHKIVRAQTIIDQNMDLYNLSISANMIYDIQEKPYQMYEITMAINKLDTELKKPLFLLIYGYKYNEIAEKLNLPLGTVKSRVFFARKELRRILGRPKGKLTYTVKQ